MERIRKKGNERLYSTNYKPLYLNIYWKIAIGIAILYYGYVYWVLKIKKGPKAKKDSENESFLQNNDIFVNNTSFEQTDLEDILDQVVEDAENNSKLLDAFEKGSSDEDDTNSLTQKKHEKLKIIRNKGETDSKEADTDS